MYIFISHSSQDAESAEKICALLEEAGHSCFIAPRDIRSGREYAEELMLGIERSDALVVMLSNNSNISPHVLREVEHAASKAIPILVYKMEEVVLTKSMEYFLMTHQWINQKVDTDFHVILDCIEAMQNGLEEQNAKKTDTLPKTERKHAKAEVFAAVIFAVVILVFAAVMFSGNRAGNIRLPGISSLFSNKKTLSLGEMVTFGRYNDEPVTWRVIHLSEDGSKAVLITENIITMKAYDAAESDAFNKENGNDYWKYASEDFTDQALEARVRGSNEWRSSNIRFWLNSEAQTVAYEGGRPVKSAMSDMKNGYENEAGFLYGFTNEEREAIVETEVETKGTITNDKVFLLNLDELKWLEDADVTILTKPTEAAVNQDATKWYSAYSLDYSIDNYYWWLREPKEGSASQCYMVTNGLTSDFKTTQIVGTEGFGIRPALAVDMRKFLTLVSE